ncbi:conserved hypothetical protein [Vibrio chagasii]|nr:conserved hypothetical protein [Vibrio chagasii]
MKKINRAFVDFFNNCDGIGVYFLSNAGVIYDADIASSTLDRFRVDFCNEFKRKYTNEDDFSVVKLSNYDGRKHALYRYDFDAADMPLEMKFTNKVLAIKPTDTIPPFRIGNSKLNELKAVIVRLEDSVSGRKFAFYQHIYPVAIVGPDKGFLNLTSHQSRLVELEEDILKLNANFIYLQVGRHYFIENIKAFESILGFKSAIHSRAKQYSTKLSQTGLVDDLTMFNERIDKETSFARKLVKVYKNSAVLKESIPNADIIEFTKQKPHFRSLSMSVSDNATSFKLDTVARCKQFLELLDDDFLKSELTGADYISKSKDRVIPS